MRVRLSVAASIATILLAACDGADRADHRLPADELAFLATIDAAKTSWEGAPNSIQRQPMRGNRDSALCQWTQVKDWVATVDHVDTYLARDDLASLAVTITPYITLRTEGDLQDSGSKIPKGTALFDSVSTLRQGDAVKFSGRFIRDAARCQIETSLTDNGSMTDPEFEFIFDRVSR